MRSLRKLWNRWRGNTPPPNVGSRLLPLNRIDCDRCPWSIPLGDDWNDQMWAWETHQHHVRTNHQTALGDTTP